jgi:hypothetical protein
MKENIIQAFNNFQIADLDDDMVGMCKALVDWIKVIREELGEEPLPDVEPLQNFYKLDPHQPRMELRKNLRQGMAFATKGQKDGDYQYKLKNLYVVLVSATYVYHMPTEQIKEAGLRDEEFTREDSKNMLLGDNMSPNWLKEPSGRDFTAIML